MLIWLCSTCPEKDVDGHVRACEIKKMDWQAVFKCVLYVYVCVQSSKLNSVARLFVIWYKMMRRTDSFWVNQIILVNLTRSKLGLIW
jgi:hypothetical protein